MLHAEEINALAVEIHSNNKKVGWWDDPNRCLYEVLQLVSTEIAEGTEGIRKDQMDDHLPERKMEEVELADAVIRMLDLGGFKHLKYTNAMAMPHAWITDNCSPAKQHLALNDLVIQMAKAIELNQPLIMDQLYSRFLESVAKICELRGYDLMGATLEKIEYNRHRADHKRENREKDGGKKF